MAVVAQPRVLLVHGSVLNGEATWGEQRALAERFELVVPNRRGFPPGPDVERVDFEDEADWLEQFLSPGTHLVGHSYGGVVSLYAAARLGDRLRSLTLVEPPAFGIAREDRRPTSSRPGWSACGGSGRTIRRSSCARSSATSAPPSRRAPLRRRCCRARGR